MGYYTVFKAVFDRVKADVEAKTNIKQVVLGGPPVIRELPLAIINPDVTSFSQVAFGSTLENRLVFEVILIIRETEPADWFTEIITVMGDVMDAILADRSLSGTVTDTTPMIFAPGEVRMANNIYFGGLLRFECLFFYSP